MEDRYRLSVTPKGAGALPHQKLQLCICELTCAAFRFTSPFLMSTAVKDRADMNRF